MTNCDVGPGGTAGIWDRKCRAGPELLRTERSTAGRAASRRCALYTRKQMDEREAQIADLKRELAALRERDQDLLDFIENASLALHFVGDDGRIVWANQTELDLLGYTREEYFGHHITEFHADASVAAEMLGRFEHRQALRNYEARLRCKDGSIRDVLISSNVRWNEGEFVYTRCFTRDITDRKRYEQRLLTQYAVGRVLAHAGSLDAAAPALLEAVASHLGWRIGLLWTPQQNGEALRCTAHWAGPQPARDGFAASCNQITFFRGVGLPGRVWSTQTPAWVQELEKDANFPRLRLAASYGFRSAFAFPLVLQGEVHGVMEFFSEQVRSVDNDLLQMAASLGYQIGEFLERTRAQQELRDREESYRVLTETASDGIVTIDAASTILFANTAAASMFGYATQELVGSVLTALIPEHTHDAYRTGFARYLETGQKQIRWEAIRTFGQHRAGYEIPVEISIGEYRRGDQPFFVGVVRDVTERNRLDESLRQTAKLESLGVLAGGIAHDFNNLLTGILGNISLAVESVEASNPVNVLLQDAIQASEKAANLTMQLLAYAGKGRFVIEPTDISARVQEISALIRSSIPKHVTLRLDLEQPLPLVDADAAQLQQLIMNLVINAAEAIPAGRQGTVLVMTRVQEVDARYLAALGNADISPGQYVTITVQDNGVGMDEATLGKIFDPFFTTKFTGRGLGLAAAGGIVRGHKGALKVFSSPGQGTTFKVLLPVAAARDRGAEPGVTPGLSRRGRGLVLVVDDEPIVRKVAATCLEKYGYHVISADNGREGVQCFEELHSQLAIVILDMTMPVMSGEEALDRMRSIDETVPIVLSSGYNELEAVKRFAGKGLSGFLQKPYSSAALADKVQSVVRETQNIARQ
jgi:PAS domain S-box-containing protein